MAQVELPSETAPDTVSIPNPVIPTDMDFSKQNFRDMMEAEKTEAAPADAPSQPTKPETPPPSEPTSEPTPDTKPEVTPEPATTADAKVETPTETPASKAFLPEELLTGKKPEPVVDEAVAGIDAMVLPKNAKPEQVASFSKLKAEAKRIIEERTARINELETKTSEGASRHEIEAAQERIKAAEEKAAEFEQTIERLAFTESPRFKQFINDEQATLTNAKGYFEGTEINPDIVEYAARATGAQRAKILREAGADAELIGLVSPYLAQYDNIQRYKTGAMENWKAGQAQYMEQVKAQEEAQVQQKKQAEDEVWSQTVHELSNLVPLRKFEKNDSWNSRADEILQKAKTVYNGEGVDLKDVAAKLIKGEAYDAMDELRIALTEELNKALAENARLKAAKPGASNGQVTAGPSNDANLTVEDRRKRDFNREMAAAKTGA